MSTAATHPQPSDLTPELAARLQEVEQELVRIQRSSATSQRWFLLGLIPRPVQVFSWVGLALQVVRVVLLPFQPLATVADANASGGWIIVMSFAGNIAGLLVTLLIATWALRYCQARSDGKL